MYCFLCLKIIFPFRISLSFSLFILYSLLNFCLFLFFFSFYFFSLFFLIFFLVFLYFSSLIFLLFLRAFLLFSCSPRSFLLSFLFLFPFTFLFFINCFDPPPPPHWLVYTKLDKPCTNLKISIWFVKRQFSLLPILWKGSLRSTRLFLGRIPPKSTKQMQKHCLKILNTKGIFVCKYEEQDSRIYH